MSQLQKLKAAQGIDHLAALLGYKAKSISYILFKLPSDKKFSKFKVKKKSGGSREISAPLPELKRLQKHLSETLYICRDEIDKEHKRPPLSHGFRKRLSIITNARRHKRRRYVLNLDLQDFFPTFNFGRVRGFFIHNKDFKFTDKVATLIAQIACHDNALPQGSPSSPIIADLIAHVLDVRLAQLAKRHQLTYSRYADDLTFSTSRRDFPSAVARALSTDNPQWTLGPELAKIIQKSGFVVNPTKTRMQFRVSRQLVTGLTVNEKVNIRIEYYKMVRAMCHRLFMTGSYFRKVEDSSLNAHKPQLISSLGPVNGMLSHINHVKSRSGAVRGTETNKSITGARKLYIKFLRYREFVRHDRPLILCEGKTDNIYLRYAIQSLHSKYPTLGSAEDSVFKSAVKFFKYERETSKVLGLTGGSSTLNYFFLKEKFQRDMQAFVHRPLRYPIIIIIDNDEGATEIFKKIKKDFSIDIDYHLNNPFYHIYEHVYLIKTPSLGSTGLSCIEDLFDISTKTTTIGGKSFNPNSDQDTDTQYGKYIFAEKVVRAHYSKIDFSGFIPLIDGIATAINHYQDVRKKN